MCFLLVAVHHRLGAPLCGLHYSPVDPALVLVRQSDNTLRILNVATLRVQTSIIGVKPRPVSALVSAAAAGSTAALHPTRGHLVLPAAGTQLQVYDPAQHRHVSMVQVRCFHLQHAVRLALNSVCSQLQPARLCLYINIPGAAAARTAGRMNAQKMSLHERSPMLCHLRSPVVVLVATDRPPQPGAGASGEAPPRWA
jgi:hypothetical protein